ncbi:type IV pilus twitching motility protein PilT [Agromyces sp. MMS24-JH15]|uniref:type IV pilus twitching motility protein PilT n=1 Tax=Agromyces sp. MMS24-JH15 TaxID=3243765 RepID=UPI00374A572B
MDDLGRLTTNERLTLARADRDLIGALREAVRLGASDLHVTAGTPPVLRVDGMLRPIQGMAPWDEERVARALTTIVTQTQLERFERKLELDFGFALASGYRFRVNFYQQRGAMGGAFRLIPTHIRSLDELGIPEAVARFATLPRGLVLVTGPTGVGKTTTMAALVDLINRTRADHIITVEDPIEFLHDHKRSIVNQREVEHDTHGFASALKHALRQDPDVIFIGELRDLDTISAALTAAETGHLVFATLHTQNAAQTIDRIIDVFPTHQQEQVRQQLAGTLQGVLAQTLVKRATGEGRVVATEVMVMNAAVANLIRENKVFQVPSVMQSSRTIGMHTLDQSLADLVNRGVITRHTAEQKAHDRELLAGLIRRLETPSQTSARVIAESDVDYGDAYSARGTR